MEKPISLSEEMKSHWDENPIGVEAFDEPVGSHEFYEKYLSYYDRFYSYKQKTFRYELYRDTKPPPRDRSRKGRRS